MCNVVGISLNCKLGRLVQTGKRSAKRAKLHNDKQSIWQVRTEDGQTQELTEHHGTFVVENEIPRAIFAGELTPGALVIGSNGEHKRVRSDFLHFP
jgi:hypothetical protein